MNKVIWIITKSNQKNVNKDNKNAISVIKLKSHNAKY